MRPRPFALQEPVSAGTVLLWSALMLAITLSAWGAQGIDRPLGIHLDMFTNADNLVPAVGPKSDILHYLQAGKELAALETIHGEYRRYWTLGMAVVVAIVTAFDGLTHYPLSMVLVSSLVWGISLGIAVSFLSPVRLAPIGAACATALWLFNSLRDWLFGPGALKSDGFAAAWLLAAIAVMLAALVYTRFSYWVVSGLLFGLSANFRYQNLMAIRLILVVMLGVVLALLWKRGYRLRGLLDVIRAPTPSPAPDYDAWLRASLRGLVVCGIALLITVVPWSAYKLAVDGTLKWYTASEELKYGRMWKPDEQQAAFAHAPNAQCHADPVLCAEIGANWGQQIRKFKWHGILTTLKHPFAVAAFKIRGFSWLWWGTTWGGLLGAPRLLLEGVLLLLAGAIGLGILAMGARKTGHPSLKLALVAACTYILLNVAMFTFLHYEWRYSVSLRVLCGVAPWFAIGMVQRAKEVPV